MSIILELEFEDVAMANFEWTTCVLDTHFHKRVTHRVNHT